MTPIRIFFLDNELLVDTIPEPFVAGSLMATLNGGFVEIRRKQSSFLFASPPWDLVADVNGNAFDTPDDAMAYLSTELSKRRSLDVPSATAVASADLMQGSPAAISRQNGQLLPARADTYAQSFVAGLVVNDIGQGFAVNLTRNPLSLDDWTPIAGTPDLETGVPYFLGAAGGITPTPQTTAGLCMVRIGEAASPRSMMFKPSDPILL